jgi:amino acid transporter
MNEPVTRPQDQSGLEEPRPALDRSMSAFSSFALSMATICILAGGLASFHVGFCSVGGAAVGVGWLLGCLFSLIVAVTMGQVASAFPLAGGPYQWASILGGKGWGWVTACFNLLGLITVLAAINVGVCRFVISSMSRTLQYNPETVHPLIQGIAVVGLIASQAFINYRGIRLTARLTDLSGYLIIAVALLLTGAMLAFGVIGKPGFDLGRLVTFENFSGAAGRDVWPSTGNLVWLFLLGLLLPAYVLTGFDASAQTAEETIDAPRNVPRGIVRGVLVSGLAGWVMLCAIVLAIPDMTEAASKGEQSFFWIIREVVPQPLRTTLYVGIVAAQYLCGLATLTAASRSTYAFARDGGLPFSRALSRLHAKTRSPAAAIWAACVVAILFALFVSYTAIAAVCAIFLYLSYVLPTMMGLLAHGRSWTRMGPWHVGRWYRPLAVLAVLGCATLIVIGMQPPNEIAVWVVGGLIVVLAGLWWCYMRHHFPGPPLAILHLLRQADTPAIKPSNPGAP